jgi:hypothetical protein
VSNTFWPSGIIHEQRAGTSVVFVDEAHEVVDRGPGIEMLKIIRKSTITETLFIWMKTEQPQ